MLTCSTPPVLAPPHNWTISSRYLQVAKLLVRCQERGLGVLGMGPTSGKGGDAKARERPWDTRHALRNLAPASDAAGRRTFSDVAERMRRVSLTWPPLDRPSGGAKQGWGEAKATVRARRRATGTSTQ